MHGEVAVLVIAEKFDRQRQKRGFFFGEHGGDAIAGKHVTVEGIEHGIIDVRDQHALAQIVELLCRSPFCSLAI
jgi:hypothetical protein